MFSRITKCKTVFLVVAILCISSCGAWRVPGLDEQIQANALIDHAVIALRQADFDAAESGFSLAGQIYRNSAGADLPAAIDGLGCTALMRGNMHAAERYFLRVLEADPAYAPVYGNLALLYEGQGNTILAERHFKKALELDPGNYRVRNNYAVFLATKSGDRRRNRLDPSSGARRIRTVNENSARMVRAEFLKASMFLKSVLLEESPIIEHNLKHSASRLNKVINP